jgi:tetratricopeptide (TPR) repeat protein
MKRFLAAFLILAGLAAPGVVHAADASPPDVKVRFGEHENFSRIVFDWPEAVPYTASLDKGLLTLDFKAAGAPDLSAFVSDPPPGIKLDSVSPSEDELKVAFAISKPAKLRQFRDGPRVVVDVLFDQNPAPKAKTVPEVPSATPAESAKTSPIEIKPVNPAVARDLPKLKVAVGQGENGIRMTFPWTDSAAAAVVQRAGQLWIVFDLPSQVDLSEVGKKLGDRFSEAEQIADDRATILHFTTRQMQYPVVRRKDDVWTVELDNVANPPATPIEAREQVTEGGTARVFMPVKDPGLKIDLKDPIVGDRLVVAPVFGSGFGFDQSRQYAEFRLLGTPQGIAIEPRADWLTVQRESNGIAITGARALAHSADTPGDKKSVSDRPALDSPTRLIDFDAWRRGSDDDYWDNLDKLLYDLSLAPSDARNAARWSLAKFYLAHHMAADALGVLGLMAKSDVRLEEDKQFRAVRGVANIFMGRYADALEDLSYPRLDAEPDAALWRAVAEAKLGKNEAALDHYHQGLDVITDYGEIDRARFQLAAATAAMGVGDVDTMNTETSVLDGMKLPVSMEAQAKYLEGRMYELQNDATSALDAYAKAIDMHYRPVAAKAEFRQIEVEAKEGKIKPKEEIDKLDALRFKWRGGPLEFDVLHKLGQRYVDEGDYRHGLEILRQAVTYFPDSDARSLRRSALTATRWCASCPTGWSRSTSSTAPSSFWSTRSITASRARRRPRSRPGSPGSISSTASPRRP